MYLQGPYYIKGIVHPKMEILSITYLHVNPNPQEIIFKNTIEDISNETSNMVNGSATKLS